jgi:thiol:disulfide interchange protein DsbD
MKLFLAVFVLFCLPAVFGQSKVVWSTTYNQETKAIEISAEISEGWHLYSQHVANDVGPVPTSFTFEENNDLKFVGKVNEPAPIQKYDETFEAMLDFFEEKVTFQQRVSVKKKTIVNGMVTFMVCNDTMCLPPTDVKFSIEINPNKD